MENVKLAILVFVLCAFIFLLFVSTLDNKRNHDSKSELITSYEELIKAYEIEIASLEKLAQSNDLLIVELRKQIAIQKTRIDGI